MKFKFATLLTAATVFYSYQSVAQSQQSPDVWSVVEQKLQNAVPLNENTTFKSQAAWFELHRELFMYGLMSRADALLKKLDTQSNDAKFSLNHEASWIAENNSPDAAMVFLSKIGLDKPSSITAYESYVDGWVNRK
ncbi:periplasmic protein, partial [Salmonella enterica subsp. enterica serovar Infantis]